MFCLKLNVFPLTQICVENIPGQNKCFTSNLMFHIKLNVLPQIKYLASNICKYDRGDTFGICQFIYLWKKHSI